jgi:uncharacterized protein YhaN
MKITKISIEGFGLFDDSFEIELAGDVALIVGDNETGKSTIFSAIDATLFGLSGESEKSVFAPHGHAAPRSGFLEIEKSTGLYRLTRNFASNHVRVEMLTPDERVLFDGSAKPGGRSDEKEAYDAVMRDVLGLESSDVFRNSVMTKQSDLPPKMKSVVRRIVSGSSSADYVAALKNLKDAVDDLSMDLPWRRATARKPRQIELLEEEIQEKKRALSEAGVAARTIEQSRDRLAPLEAELSEVEDAITGKKAWHDTLASFTQALKDKRILEGQLNEYRQERHQIEKLNEDLMVFLERINTEYSQYVQLPDRAGSDIAGLAQLMESEKELEERRRRPQEETSRFRLSNPAITAIAAGLLTAGIGLFFFAGLLRIFMVFLGVGMSIGIIARAYFALRSQHLARRGMLEELERQLQSLKDQIREVRDRYPALAQSTPAEFLGRLGEFKQVLHKKKEIEAALGQHADLAKIVSEYDRISNELVIVDNKIGGLKSQRPSLGDIERDERHGSAMEEAKGAIPGLESNLKELAAEREEVVRALVAAEAKETVSEETLAEEIEETEQRLERLRLSRDAHIIAVEALEEAEEEFRASHLSRLNKRATSLLEKITSQRCSVRLDEMLEPLGLERSGQSLNLDQLSQGIRDQLYFALRLAAVEEISGEERLPILLDDPFVNFDERRLRAVLEMLEKLSESYQVVLLAHDRRYCDWRNPVCILER